MFAIRPLALGGAAGAILAGLSAATCFIADAFGRQRALGAPLVTIGKHIFYPPWAALYWTHRWAHVYPKPFTIAGLLIGAGFIGAVFLTALSVRRLAVVKPFGKGAWGDLADAKDADLLCDHGAVLGKLKGRVLCFDGLEHQILVGASRSGKGRGHVVPTLLAWPHSALVLDVKGELADGDPRHHFAGTAGFRQTLGPVLRFAPTKQDSASFNPLLEVRKGANEVRDVQNIVEILVDPQGDGRHQDFWDRSAKSILVGVILHVLYAEPQPRKTLAVVRELLADLDATAAAMKSTLHRQNPLTGEPETHPEVLHAAQSFLAGEERLQSGVKATAESFFGLFADELIAQKTATSDFRIGDLMCAARPVTLYLQPPPSDALRLTPLLRLVINQIARALMEDQGRDAQGREKRHPLILVLDEFPLLGRMTFFETMMGAMAGYGLKAFLVAQSLNHLSRAYGRDNVILDNCRIVTAFAAADNDTAKKIADMAGEVWELRESQTHRRPRPLIGRSQGSTTIREERRPLLLPADVRALAGDEQLIFVSGAKPIRAKKLKFDQEPVFAARLRPSDKGNARLSSGHDWQEVGRLGVIAPQTKGKPRSALAKPRAEQLELFAHTGARTKISDQAMAGFRRPDGTPLPHPAAASTKAAQSARSSALASSRPVRAKGV